MFSAPTAIITSPSSERIVRKDRIELAIDEQHARSMVRDTVSAGGSREHLPGGRTRCCTRLPPPSLSYRKDLINLISLQGLIVHHLSDNTGPPADTRHILQKTPKRAERVLTPSTITTSFSMLTPLPSFGHSVFCPCFSSSPRAVGLSSAHRVLSAGSGCAFATAAIRSSLSKTSRVLSHGPCGLGIDDIIHHELRGGMIWEMKILLQELCVFLSSPIRIFRPVHSSL